MKHSSASFGKEQVWGCYQIPGMSRRGSGREREVDVMVVWGLGYCAVS